MPRNGQGQFLLPAENPVQSGDIIKTAWANPTMTDIANGLSTSIATDGQTAPTANLPMAGFRHTNVGNALAINQYAAAGQAQSWVLNIVANVQNDAGKVSYTGTIPFGIGAGAVAIPTYMPIIFVPSANNGGPSTLALNTGAPHPILNQDLTPLVANQLRVGRPYSLVYGGANWVLITNTLDLGQLDQNYLRLAGGTMTGALYTAQNPASAMEAANKQWVEGLISGSVAGVSSFNTRIGAVTLLSADVTNALAYTPFNAAGGTIGGTVNVTGNVVASGLVFAKKVQLTQVVVNPAIGTVTLDVANNQTFILTMTGNVTIVLSGAMGPGNIGRITFLNTAGFTVAWPANVVWPLPVVTPPVVDAGTVKKCVVVLEVDGANFLANASVY